MEGEGEGVEEGGEGGEEEEGEEGEEEEKKRKKRRRGREAGCLYRIESHRPVEVERVVYIGQRYTIMC